MASDDVNIDGGDASRRQTQNRRRSMAIATDVFVVRTDDPSSPAVYGDVSAATRRIGEFRLHQQRVAWEMRNRPADRQFDASADAVPPTKIPRIEINARGGQRRSTFDDDRYSVVHNRTTSDDVDDDGTETEEDPSLAASSSQRGEQVESQFFSFRAKKRRRADADDDDRVTPRKSPFVVAATSVADEKPERRRFVEAANRAPDISDVPADPEAITRLHLDPNNPDAKVPPPNKCGAYGLSAYSWFIYDPTHPPHPQYSRWREYEDWMTALVYRSRPWKYEHDKFMSASLAASALGVSTRDTPQQAWFKLRFPSALEKEDLFDIRIMESGVQHEALHRELYAIMLRGSAKLVSGCGTRVHPTEKWFAFTPDDEVYSNDGTEHIRDVEYKTPVKRAVYLEVPEEYMPQLQIVMQGDNVDEDDFCSMRADPETGYCRWVAIRVHRSDEYWARAHEVLCEFARAVLVGSKPPPKGTFDPPYVKTEMLVRLEDALDLVPDGRGKLAKILEDTEKRARLTLTSIQQHNEMVRSEQLAIDISNRASGEAAFDADIDEGAVGRASRSDGHR